MQRTEKEQGLAGEAGDEGRVLAAGREANKEAVAPRGDLDGTPDAYGGTPTLTSLSAAIRAKGPDGDNWGQCGMHKNAEASFGNPSHVLHADRSSWR